MRLRLEVWHLALVLTRPLPMPARSAIVGFIASVGR